MLKIVYFDSNRCDELPRFDNLPKNVIEKISVKEKKSYRESLYAWYILQYFAEEWLGISDLHVTFNENGKPIFEQFYASISHSKGVIVVAISTEEVGIDIEKITSISRIEKLINTLYAHPLDASVNPVMHFYMTFTKKEAKMKYEGKKLGYPRHQLDVGIEDVKSLLLTIQDERYVLSYVSSVTPEVFEIKLIKNGMIQYK
ncbi:MAG: hypothetical protein NC182_02620 [Prevotella sp.]|nr:hypothetical protein [Staphylococcus sp.]MCM1350078.1 hypothetical protein [Prevotella sp.]